MVVDHPYTQSWLRVKMSPNDSLPHFCPRNDRSHSGEPFPFASSSSPTTFVVSTFCRIDVLSHRRFNQCPTAASTSPVRFGGRSASLETRRSKWLIQQCNR